MRISESRIRRIIREEMVRETKHRFPSGNMMLRGRPADINFDYGMRNRLDPDYNTEDDMSQWATIPAAPGSPSDTMGYRDQEKDVLKLNPKVVASKIIDSWGAKDTLGMLEILKADAGNDEDYHDAMVWMYTALKTAVDIDMDPAGRDHTPSEKKWIESVVGETYRQASAHAGRRGGFDPRQSMGRHFGPPVKGMNEIRRIVRGETHRSLVEMRGPEAPMRVFETIRSICEEALMNKSLGVSPRIADDYEQQIKDELRKLGGHQDLGGDAEWDPDRHGFGGRMPSRRRS